MGRSASTSRAGGQLALLLIAIALLLRVAVPAGWMPSADGRSIELCTGAGTVAAWVDGDGRIHKDPPVEKKADQPCAFAGMAAPLLAAPFPAMPLPAIAIAPAIVGPFLLSRVGQGLPAPPPPATGPPATS